MTEPMLAVRSDGTVMHEPAAESGPYRSAADRAEPLTDGELALWDRVYAATVASGYTSVASLNADNAVRVRRTKFGVR